MKLFIIQGNNTAPLARASAIPSLNAASTAGTGQYRAVYSETDCWSPGATQQLLAPAGERDGITTQAATGSPEDRPAAMTYHTAGAAADGAG